MPIANVEDMRAHEATGIRIDRWPTERPLFILNAIAAACLWVAFLASGVAAVQWLAIVVGFTVLTQLAFIAWIRGSAVRLGPDQFPELHARAVELARLIGPHPLPDIYLAQQDGALNAFATRFFRSHIVVLFSDLLEACGENTAARDMIIGHELGHIRAGHLRWRWFLWPAALLPFLGSALSRAREYTCDRYGRAAAGDLEGALLGLTILAAGGRYGRNVNRAALVRQRSDLRGAWMLLGEWLGSHPPLSKRLRALAPELDVLGDAGRPTSGRWLRPALASAGVFVVGAIVLAMWFPYVRTSAAARRVPPSVSRARDQVAKDFERLKALVESDARAGRPIPWDVWDLYQRWDEVHPDAPPPEDPFSGYWYSYEQQAGAYRLLSTGPDGEGRTRDDIVYDSRAGARHK